MKIKELHLRNIASIEKADIDFENGLNDSITGEQAPIFLISGDTGAGKSVILDGISMALYKKTPRVVDVKGKQNNDFKDEQGNPVSIFSIEQYTRLGITERDECYSLVVFEGNDGIIYQAKLELGLSKQRKGNQGLRYSDPKWTVKAGAGDWVKVEAKTGQPILGAVGLDFEQFSRMAMLAQGQFASFLTGEKKERESILERLTNTEHFSVYGRAIKSLYDKAKSEKNQAQKTYEDESRHTMPAEKVEQCIKEYNEHDATKKELEQKIANVDNKIKAKEKIELSQETIQKNEIEKQKLKDFVDSDEYKDKAQLVTDWTATEKERQCLTDLQTAQEKLEVAKNSESRLATMFKTLSSDLGARMDAVAEEEKAIAAEQLWLDEREDRSTLYTNSGEILSQLSQYKEKTAKLRQTEMALAEEKSKTPDLAKRLDNARRIVIEKAEAVTKKQQALDEVIAQRDDLKPDSVNSRLNEIAVETATLKSLADYIGDYNKKTADAERVEKEIKAEGERLARLKIEAEDAKKFLNEARKQHEEANNRLTTMNASMQDYLTNLRNRLISTHETVCPLCGQQLETIHMEQDFRDILTPIENEQKYKHNALQTAENKYNEVNNACSACVGSLSEKKKHKENLQADIDTVEKKVRAEAEKAAIEIAESFMPDVVAAKVENTLNARVEEVNVLKKKQKEVSDLQNKITALINDKKPLDAEKSKAENNRAAAEHNLKANEEAVERLTEESKQKNVELNALISDINEKTGVFYSNWRNDVDTAKQTIAGEAELYKENKSNYDKHVKNLAEKNVFIANLQKNFKTLSSEFPDCDVPDSHIFYNCADIVQEWTSLTAKKAEIKSQIKSLSDTIAERKTILDEYYASTEKTEADLIVLSKRGNQLDEARRLVQETSEKLHTCESCIVQANNAIEWLLSGLGVEALDDIPTKEELMHEKDGLNVSFEEIVEEMGSLKEKLDENNRNIAILDEARKKLDVANRVYEKWDVLNNYFGDTRFRTLVQTYVLRPLLNNANIYLEKITDRYRLTCSDENEQLSILVHDMYNKGQVRSATILSGGERFMISLALSLALSSLNRSDMNVNILFIDEGFGTLDEKNLNSVMSTLEKLQEIAGQSNRRVGIISHREELEERLPVKIMVRKRGEGRSIVQVTND